MGHACAFHGALVAVGAAGALQLLGDEDQLLDVLMSDSGDAARVGGDALVAVLHDGFDGRLVTALLDVADLLELGQVGMKGGDALGVGVQQALLGGVGGVVAHGIAACLPARAQAEQQRDDGREADQEADDDGGV